MNTKSIHISWFNVYTLVMFSYITETYQTKYYAMDILWAY